MIMEDSHTIKNNLAVLPYQFDELIDETGAVPEYGPPEWQENHNISHEYWETYHKEKAGE